MSQDIREHSSEERRELIREALERLNEQNLHEVKFVLESMPAADVAEVIEELPAEQKPRVFKLLESDDAGEVLSEVNTDTVHDLADALFESVADAAKHMEPDEVADLLEALPEEQRRGVLSELPTEEAHKARELLVHPADTAGGIMTPEFLLLDGDTTAAGAIEILQRSRESETSTHLFAKDKDERLIGHLPLHRLVFARPDRKLSELAETELAAVTPDTDREEVVRVATHYGLGIVPVVDEGGRLVGVITTDDILDAGREEADEDMYRLAGTNERDPVHATVLRSTRLRLPWLLLTLVGGLVIAFLVSRFASALTVAQIAFFIPLIPLMGGNVAIQAATIVVRGLAVGDIERGHLLSFIVKQWMVTLVLALCCGVAALAVALLLPWVDNRVALVVGTAVAFAITVAGTLGTLLPLMFHKMGIDPAVSAGPFVTVLNDLICIAIYLSLGASLA